MADVKFTALPAGTPDAADIVAFSDLAGPTSQKCTVSALIQSGLGVVPTTAGLAFLDISTPGTITFPKITATNDVVAESASVFRASIGASIAGAAIFTLAGPAGNAWLMVNALGAAAYQDASTTKTSLSLNNLTNDAQIKASDFPASSVDGEVSLFSGTTGKAQKRATGSGLALLTAGVLSAVTDNRTNWDTAFTDRNKWDGGATGLVAATGRASLSVCEHYENANTSQISVAAAGTYLTGSTITLPANGWVAGGWYVCKFELVKSTGTGAVVIVVRIGTLGTTSDAAIATFTLPAGTSVGDTGNFEVRFTIRTIGASATSVGLVNVTKNQTTTGISNTGNQVVAGSPTAGTAFNSTTATKIGVSVAGGTAWTGTCDIVHATYMQ